jgi:molybdopterin biosynthesis enzyme
VKRSTAQDSAAFAAGAVAARDAIAAWLESGDPDTIRGPGSLARRIRSAEMRKTNVRIKKQSKNVRADSLNPGDVFEAEGEFYLMLPNMEAANVESGDCVELLSDELVTPVDAEMVVGE